ncbi:MAG: hypothetical protein V3V75_07730 [Thermoguttaceae bacterium]
MIDAPENHAIMVVEPRGEGSGPVKCHRTRKNMQFIEMSGKTLMAIVSDDEFSPDDLASAGVTGNTVIRINRQGDIEIRRADRWDVIGGLLGDFEHRIRSEAGLEWV